MIDLTTCKKEINKFGGSEQKISLIYNGRRYMVKFPDAIRQKNNSLSYINNTFSEDIGCKIFNALGIKAQNTFLATYRLSNNEQKIVVACEDFTQDGEQLIEFSKLALQNIEHGSARTQAELENVLDTLRYSDGIADRRIAVERFWDMFIVDGFIRNRDRNLDNWGFLQDNEGALCPAPIYDCGSSLSPLLSEDVMKWKLADKTCFKEEEFNVYSCFRIRHQRIRFSDILQAPNRDLKSAILRVVPVIKENISSINNIIESTPVISDIHKMYMKQGLALRLNEILYKAYKRQKNLSVGISR